VIRLRSLISFSIEMRTAAHRASIPLMAQRKNPAAVALGSKGGKATAKKLTPAQRAEMASKAATARWGKKAKG